MRSHWKWLYYVIGLHGQQWKSNRPLNVTIQITWPVATLPKPQGFLQHWPQPLHFHLNTFYIWLNAKQTENQLFSFFFRFCCWNDRCRCLGMTEAEVTGCSVSNLGGQQGLHTSLFSHLSVKFVGGMSGMSLPCPAVRTDGLYKHLVLPVGRSGGYLFFCFC